MNKGVLFFAFDNEEISYTEIANNNAQRVKNILNVPVAVVTSKENESNLNSIFDEIILIDESENNQMRVFSDGKESRKRLSWKNFNRTKAYDLTPFDQTILMDVDYLVQNDTINAIWNYDFPLAMNHNAKNLVNKDLSLTEQRVHPAGINMYWATVVYFRKCPLVRSFFNIVRHVEENYNYYSRVYHYSNNLFRNDYVFSIAAHVFNDFNENDIIPEMPNSPMVTALNQDRIIGFGKDHIKFMTTKYDEKQNKVFNLPIKIYQDVHVLNKLNLMEMQND